MNWKVEHWGYSELEAAELEQHLNDMAERGYVLRWANSSGIHNMADCWARFDRTDTHKKYAVDVLSEENEGYEDYILLCHDAGWKKKAHLYNGLCIFEAEKGAERPLYVDDEARFEQLASYANQEYGASSPFALASVIAAILAGLILLFRLAMKFPSSELFFVLLLILALNSLRYLGNLLYISRLERMSREERNYEKPRILCILNLLAGKSLTLYCLGVFIAMTWCTWGDLPWGFFALLAAFCASPMVICGVFCGYMNKRTVKNVLLSLVIVVMIIAVFLYF